MTRRLSVSVLASGSRGNATYISDGRTAILVDAGLSGVEIQRRMAVKAWIPARWMPSWFPTSIQTTSMGWGSSPGVLA
jgi:hypothetical protein